MNPLSIVRAAARPRVIAALTGTAAIAATAGLTAAPAGAAVSTPAAHSARPASTAVPPVLPASLRRSIEKVGVRVQVVDHWEAVSGSAAAINDIRADAYASHIGTLTQYTGYDETGDAVLIFTDSGHATAESFQVTGTTFLSAVNDSYQTWYIVDGSGKTTSTVPSGTAINLGATASPLDYNLNRDVNPTTFYGVG